MYKYGFIGAGNMGGAIINAVAKCVDPSSMYISDRSEEKTTGLSSTTGCVISDNEKVAAECDMIFLGVKPQMMEEVLSGIKDILRERKERFVLVSMAAGTDIATIRRLAGGDYPVIRIMPNLPVLVGEGMTFYCTADATEDDVMIFREAMKMSGAVCGIKEELIDVGSAVAGCSPAYVAMFIEALADGGVMAGLTRSDALFFAEQAVAGTAKLLIASGAHPEEFKDRVCSPGGTTIAGVKALEDKGFRSAVISACCASLDKTKELTKK